MHNKKLLLIKQLVIVSFYTAVCVFLTPTVFIKGTLKKKENFANAEQRTEPRSVRHNEDDSSTKAGYQILTHFLYLCPMTIEKLNDMRSRIAGIRRFL